MKTTIFAIIMLISLSIKAQDYNPYGFECSFTGTPPDHASASLIGGFYKPESISDYTTNTDAYFPVLIVYVQFQDDPGPDWEECPWHQNEDPDYLNTVIATSKASGYGNNWWDAYNGSTKTLSDYWMEVSRGKLHLVGREVSIILPHDVDWYEDNGNLPQAMEDLFNALATEVGNDWPLYDKWSKVNGTFVYGDGDGYVDMMYIVARSNPCSSHSPGWGYFRPEGKYNACTHGQEHTVYSSGGVTIKLRRDFSETGSGFQISPGGCGNGVMYAPLDKWQVVSFSGHEHGHYFFGTGYIGDGYHQQYSKVNNYHGWEEYLSPYELIKLGYQDPQVFDFDSPNKTLYDWTSRGSTSQILKVPIGSENRNEFFLIANRQQVSDYDRIMWGDTAHGNPYKNMNSEYNKGIYIYHAYPGYYNSSGYPWGIHIDQECADGLWNWTQNGSYHPDWSCSQQLPFFEKSSVIYNVNDNGGEVSECQGSLNYHDGKSLGLGACAKWFSIGKTVNCESNADGTDRIYANETEVWTSRELQGDRWDAWEVDYNQVFSPYSSPSTVDWDNNQTGIFIYLESQESDQADFKIYKVGEGGYSEDDILEATPPSRPVLYKPVELVNCSNDWAQPRITWDNNKEPDMVRTGDFKRYKIYRAGSVDLNHLPGSYAYIDTYDDYTPDDTANYIDNHVQIYCGFYPQEETRYFRYKIVAIDKYDDESVKSDFVSTAGTPTTPDNPGFNNLNPINFTLSQNYPNPFNPITEIKYSIPFNAVVKIKVFNLLGQEIMVLVNEYKETGYHSVTFDGTNIPSGVYFYTIEAGEYKASKKMVLVK